MSVGAQLWRQIVSRVEAVPQRGISEAVPRVVHSVAHPASSLMHQLFFPSPTIRRSAVLLAATDAQSKASGLCEQLAIALSNSSGEMVGIIESCDDLAFKPIKKGPETSFGRPVWQACTVPVAERVRRIPSALVCDDLGKNGDSLGGGLNVLRSAFSYFLLSTAITDSEMPLLCNLCDAAVLIVTANLTRKQAALRAKELLLRQGVTLLGVVLDQRTLPIPESIYRRL